MKRGNAGVRPQRVGEALREVLSTEVQGGLRDPDVGFVTVTGVDVSKDLRNAKVHVSIMGTEQEKKRSLAALRRAAGYLRGEAGRALQLQFAPELDFRVDESLERAQGLEAVLRKAREEDAELARMRGEAPPAPVAPAPGVLSPLPRSAEPPPPPDGSRGGGRGGR